MAIKWSAESDHVILLAIVKHSEAKVPMELFEKIAAKLGEGTTASACYQRYYKLKKEAENLLPKSDDATGPSTTPVATPAKKGRATPVKKTGVTPKSTGSKSKKRKVEDDEVDVTEEATPSKKAKAADSKPTVEAEDDDLTIAGDDDDDE